jgi:hypothetical protein
VYRIVDENCLSVVTLFAFYKVKMLIRKFKFVFIVPCLLFLCTHVVGQAYVPMMCWFLSSVQCESANLNLLTRIKKKLILLISGSMQVPIVIRSYENHKYQALYNTDIN